MGGGFVCKEARLGVPQMAGVAAEGPKKEVENAPQKPKPISEMTEAERTKARAARFAASARSA